MAVLLSRQPYHGHEDRPDSIYRVTPTVLADFFVIMHPPFRLCRSLMPND